MLCRIGAFLIVSPVGLIQRLAYLFWHSATGHDKHWMKIELPGCIICLQERCGSAPVLLYISVLIACWVMHYGGCPFNKTKIRQLCTTWTGCNTDPNIMTSSVQQVRIVYSIRLIITMDVSF